MGTEGKRLDMAAIRAKLGGSSGSAYWKGLEELADTDEFQAWLEDEFPHRRSLPDVDRRSVLKLMGASLALAGLAGCRTLPQEKVIPFVRNPEDRAPGTALYYATAFPFAGYAFPVVVESHEGRPTKLDGNPDHPASRGVSDSFTQATILNMYDPDRAGDVTNKGLINTWDSYFAMSRKMLEGMKANGGAGFHLLTGVITSPSTFAQIQRFLKAFPNAQWHQYEPVNNDNEMAGTRMAFGESVQPIYRFAEAKAVLSLDGCFLGSTPHTVGYARDFAETRQLNVNMSRLWAVESSPSITGAYADHRVTVTPAEVVQVAAAVAAKLGVVSVNVDLPKGVTSAWIDALADDLSRGGAVYVGAHQSAEVHAIAHAINKKINAPVDYYPLAEKAPVSKLGSLAQLASAMSSGKVKTLLIAGVNPVYNAPGDLKFGDVLPAVSTSIYLGEFRNETSKLCQWNLPEACFLEAWGDLPTLDGTVTIQQPLIEPLHGGKSLLEVLALMMKDTRTGEELVRETWKSVLPNQAAWEKALNDGYIAATKVAPKNVTSSLAGLDVSPKAPTGTYAVFLPDPTIWDGTYANNGWLQELPKPLTKMTWDNPVLMSPAMADQLGVQFEDHVQVTANGVTVEAPVFVQPGHPDNVVTLHMGGGRTHGGKVQAGAGFDFMKLRSSKNPHFAVVQVEKAKGKTPLASSQLHHSMEGRDIIREGTLAQYMNDPSLKPEGLHELEDVTLYNLTKEWEKYGYPQYGMVIDLNLCTGCNACVSACQTENNIPTVGKGEVSRGREMHWIRVDRYYRVREAGEMRDMHTGAAESFGSMESPIQTGQMNAATAKDVLDPNMTMTVFQPITCMHCETAPCEPVCPVAATVHSHEGLNQMVYNRCVGTRYCSNNCPYKVRRFNYYNYQFGSRDPIPGKDYGQRNFQSEQDIKLLRLLHNPDVTVRSRGVMEKCTYCVQRINEARIVAKKERREIKDGEIVTACQQACPTKAITFGNLADATSAVTKARADKRNYGLLTELNTRPRTTYLGRVRNPHPALEKA